MIYDNLYWFEVIALPATLNISKNDFYCHSRLLLLFSVRNSIIYLRNFILTLVTTKYLFLAFIDGSNHFFLQYLHNSTVDFKLVW